MSTKKGYIVEYNDQLVVAEHSKGLQSKKEFIYNGVFYAEPIPIHPSSLPTILSNGSLKPEYQGEVEYEIDEVKKIDYEDADCSIGWVAHYAIPKPVESKGDVWEEAWVLACNRIEQLKPTDPYDIARVTLTTLEKFYTLTKKQ